LGRHRKSDTGLEPHACLNHGPYYYVHREGCREPLGKNQDGAKHKGRLHNATDGKQGTVVYWLDQFLLHCKAWVKAKTLAVSTLDDYWEAIMAATETRKRVALRVFFVPPRRLEDVRPNMLQSFLTTMA